VIAVRAGPVGDTGVTGATGATGPNGMFKIMFYRRALSLQWFLLNMIVDKSSAIDEVAIHNLFACLIMMWLCAQCDK